MWKTLHIFGRTIQLIPTFVHMHILTVQKELLAMLHMRESAYINYVNIIFLAVITFEYFIGVCIISLCTADIMCVHFFHPKQEHNSFWVQNKSVLILQIMALHSMQTDANHTDTVSFHQFSSSDSAKYSFPWMSFIFECVPITVAYNAS